MRHQVGSIVSCGIVLVITAGEGVSVVDGMGGKLGAGCDSVFMRINV